VNAAKITPLRPQAAVSILVVEDDVLTRCVIADELRAEGYRVLEASTAQDAITILASVPVHLAFIDLNVPGPREGLRVAEAARRRQPPAKVILTSGKVRPEQLADAESFGPFIVKPYLITRVLDAVRSSLAVGN
jgi:CheY-like chemotaxis protein